ILPGMPMLPFFALGGALYYAGHNLRRHNPRESEDAAPADPRAAAGKAATAQAAGKPGDPANAAGGANAASASVPEELRKLIDQDTFAIEVGYGLLPLADAKQGGDLLARITGVRKTLARERGVIVPPIAVRDNLELESNDYRFLLRGKTVGRGKVYAGKWMAMNVSGSKVTLRGSACREPVFGLDAVWIDAGARKAAELNGYTAVDAASVVITHLSASLKSSSH